MAKRIKLIKIGTSRGVRIPKYLIEKYKFGEEIQMLETEKGLLLFPDEHPRAGWAESFAKHAEADELIETPPPESDEQDWEW